MPSSTIDKALSSTKSFIETFTSSDNPTTTFTEHTVTSVKKSAGFFSKIIGFISQPKFKWYILGLLLCVIAFIYFKFQNKKLNKRNENNTEKKEEFNINNIEQENNLNNTLEERDKVWISKINEMKQQFNNQLATQAEINTQLVAKLQTQQTQQTHQTPQSQQVSAKKQNSQKNNTNIQQPLPQQPQLTEQLTDTTSSEEIFIEDKNVMEHNLTAEEMYAIDRQLEDVNIDHLMHASE